MATGFKQATVNASDVPSTLSGYPSYVDLSRLGITTLAEAQSVRCYSDSAKTTELAREIVSATEMHVKIPSLTSTFVLYVDYDGVRADYAVSDTYGRNAVWSGYIAVYHFQGTAATSPKLENATGDTSLNATENGSPSSATGKLGTTNGAYDFTGSTVGVTVADDAALEVSQITTQSWVKTTDTRYVALWARYDGALARVLRVIKYSTQKLWSVHYDSSNQNSGVAQSSASINTGNWVLIHTMSDGSNDLVRQYINGTADGTAAFTSKVLQTGHNVALKIGLANNIETTGVDGSFDEFRIRENPLSANWITTEYNNQSDESGFWGTWSDAGGATPTRNAIFAFGGM